MRLSSFSFTYSPLSLSLALSLTHVVFIVLLSSYKWEMLALNVNLYNSIQILVARLKSKNAPPDSQELTKKTKRNPQIYRVYAVRMLYQYNEIIYFNASLVIALFIESPFQWHKSRHELYPWNLSRLFEVLFHVYIVHFIVSDIEISSIFHLIYVLTKLCESFSGILRERKKEEEILENVCKL